MKKNQSKKTLGRTLAIAFAVVFAVSVLSFAIVAYQGGMKGRFAGKGNTLGPNYDSDVHAQLEAALDAGDYEQWLAIRQQNGLTGGRMMQQINAENFALYAQMHDAQLAGDTARAAELRAQLGLGARAGGAGAGSHAGCAGSASGVHDCQNKAAGSATGGCPYKASGECVNDALFVDANGDGICDHKQ